MPILIYDSISLASLSMKNISDKNCRGNQSTHFMCNNFFFLENRAFYEIMWKNMVELNSSQMTI